MTDGFLPDRMIERVREVLRAAPATEPDQRAVARLLSAVWAAPRPSRWQRAMDALRMPALTRVGALAVTGAALALGFVMRGTLEAPTVPVAPIAGNGIETPVQFAAATDRESMAVPTQFVFDDRTAQRVSVVGEFNGWQAGKTPLTRLESGLWTVTVPLTPGRHVYAFVLDDTLVKADPRAPKVRDADYGREGSVVMVFAR